MNNLYEALEICLQELEQGADMEATLARYPDLADELRPILEASVGAWNIAAPGPSKEVVQRNRAKVLQHASQMRESRSNSSRRLWFASFRRLAVTLVVLAVLSASGNGLVRAASNTLPGDNLYPVKRTWEDVLVAFTFNVQQRDALEVEHENERLNELQEVFAEGRSAQVDFAGSVTQQNGNQWVVSNVPVTVSSQTEIRGGPINVGSAVRVKGHTQGSSAVVVAERIELLPAGAKLPDIGDEPEIGTENHEGSNGQTDDNSGKGSGDEAPQVEETRAPEQDAGHEDGSVTQESNKDNESNTEETQSPENSNDHTEDYSNDNTGTEPGDSSSNDSHENSTQNSNEDSGGSYSGSDSSVGGGGD